MTNKRLLEIINIVNQDYIIVVQNDNSDNSGEPIFAGGIVTAREYIKYSSLRESIVSETLIEDETIIITVKGQVD